MRQYKVAESRWTQFTVRRVHLLEIPRPTTFGVRSRIVKEEPDFRHFGQERYLGVPCSILDLILLQFGINKEKSLNIDSNANTFFFIRTRVYIYIHQTYSQMAYNLVIRKQPWRMPMQIPGTVRRSMFIERR